MGGRRFGKKTINKKGCLKRELGQLAKLVGVLAKTVIFSGWNYIKPTTTNKIQFHLNI